jgi:predicted Zn finger-like uncharacterized protein
LTHLRHGRLKTFAAQKHCSFLTWNYPRPSGMDAKNDRAYTCMAETFKCPHCGALYEVTYDKTPPGDRHAGHCQVCGRPMDTRSDRTIPHYELVRMPDGTNI